MVREVDGLQGREGSLGGTVEVYGCLRQELRNLARRVSVGRFYCFRRC